MTLGSQSEQNPEVVTFSHEDIARAEAILKAQALLGELMNVGAGATVESIPEKATPEAAAVVPAPVIEPRPVPNKPSMPLPKALTPPKPAAPLAPVTPKPKPAARKTKSAAFVVGRSQPMKKFNGLPLCAEVDPEIFFPETGGSTREAKSVCLSCEIREECLDGALEAGEVHGIWGGLSDRERRKIKHKGPELHRSRHNRLNQLLDTISDGSSDGLDTVDAMRLAVVEDGTLLEPLVDAVIALYVNNRQDAQTEQAIQRITRYFKGEDLDVLLSEHKAAYVWLQQSIELMERTMLKMMDIEELSPASQCYVAWLNGIE